MIDEIRSPEMLKEIGLMKGSGKSWSAITKVIGEKIGKKITIPSVMRAHEIYASRSAEIISGDDELKGMLKTAVINQTEQLEEINNTVRGLMKKLVENNYQEPQLIINAAKEIREQIGCQVKLLNNLQDGFDMTKINRLEYTKISVNNLDELERAGYIKILQKPGSLPDLNAKEVISMTSADFKELSDQKNVVVNNHYMLQVVDEENADKEDEEVSKK